jgi:two-component system cell cycle response regulator
VDGLKRLNDRDGHAAGNALLSRLGRVLRSEARECDAAARYGGDEFVVLLPHSTLDEGRRFGERVARRLRDPRDEGPATTVSVGLAELDPTHPSSPAELLAAADAALYCAKRAGGDRLCAPPAAGCPD